MRHCSILAIGLGVLLSIPGCVGPPLEPGPAELPDGTEDLPYSAELVSDGRPPFSWRVTDGALPRGLGLSDAGHILGEPSEVGTFTFAANVRDSSFPPRSGDELYTIPTCPTHAWASPTVPPRRSRAAWPRSCLR